MIVKGVDAALERVGNFGRWQKRVCVIVNFMQVIVSLHAIGAVFLGATPDHYCHVPAMDEEETSDLDAGTSRGRKLQSILKNLSIPSESRCEYFDHDYGGLLRNLNETLSAESPWSQEELRPYLRNSTIACGQWVFEDSVFKSTVVSEWSLVCGRRWLSATVQASFMCGFLFGSLFTGQISDAYGRRFTIRATSLLSVVAATTAAFAKNYTLFLALRFIIAFVGAGMMLTGFILMTEVINPDKRSLLGMLYGASFGVGVAIIPVYAYFLRDWRMLQLAIAMTSLLMLANYWLLYESPRWLVSKGRTEEAVGILIDIAKTNGRPPPGVVEIFELLQQEELKANDTPTVSGVLRGVLDMFKTQLTLLRTPKLRRRCLISFFIWMVNSMIYYGLTFSGGNLQANLFLMMSVSGIADIVSIFLGVVILKRLGRRMTMCSMLLICGVSSLLILAVPKDKVYLSFTLAQLGRFFNCTSFQLCYLYTSELAPTSVRNAAVGSSSMFARLGSAIAPYIVDLLGDVHFAIPSTIFGALSLAAALLALLLPETSMVLLPETIEEVEAAPR